MNYAVLMIIIMATHWNSSRNFVTNEKVTRPRINQLCSILISETRSSTALRCSAETDLLVFVAPANLPFLAKKDSRQ